jgi:NADH-quinone oxidoreductase subunit N
VYFLLLFSLILLSSCDLLLSYLALEGVSLALYTLTINTYHKRVAIEATLKYFVSGGFSSGLFIYGNSIIFGLTGTSNYIQIKHTLRSVFVSFDLQNYVATVDVITPSTIEVCFSTICFLTTFFFKVAAFPCHMWAPDVYVGV